ncbi:HNH endonuclease [Arthrobacter sp. JSM 101049]|uniref:HNH endonuclease n=1 Tax=Arthrobacter sp. JSM 101049 TaxID=929097 RepID=UPI0035642255
MFEEFSGSEAARDGDVPAPAPAGAPAAPAGTAGFAGDVVSEVEALVEQLSAGGVDLPEKGLVDLLAALDAVKSAASAYQARAAVALRERVVERERAAGVRQEKLGASAGAQLALARRESPHRGERWMGFSRVLVNEMPHTVAALRSGRISEWRAMLMVRETACLSLEDRQKVDEALMADPQTTDGVGDRRLVAMAKQLAGQMDATALVRRARKAVGDRHVSLRPAADTMGVLNVVLPVAQAVAVFKALSRAADTASSQGEVRSRGQVMADTLVERVTGQARAGDTPVEVQLVMTDRTLFQGDVEPAFLPGYGVVPAQIARDLLLQATTPTAPEAPETPAGAETENAGPRGTPGRARPSGGGEATRDAADAGRSDGPGEQAKELVWLRRLYTAPGTGALVGLDSRARLFPDGLRRFIELRDQVCARPWCEAPIRERDHVLGWAAGGKTTAANGAGLCKACNLGKEAPGWHSREVPGDRHTIETTTPTGHTYRAQAPALPGTRP